jgi:hypothetical protein
MSRNSLIHVIGDSHCMSFSGGNGTGNYHISGNKDYTKLDEVIFDSSEYSLIHEPFKLYTIGPRTAYCLYKRKKLIDALLNLYWVSGDYVLFCVGEIDCRIHIIEQNMIQKKSINILVKECVNKFFDFIYLNYADKNLIGYFVPTTNNGCYDINLEFYKQIKELFETKELPFITLLKEIEEKKVDFFDGTHLDSVVATKLLKEKMSNLHLKGLVL